MAGKLTAWAESIRAKHGDWTLAGQDIAELKDCVVAIARAVEGDTNPLPDQVSGATTLTPESAEKPASDTDYLPTAGQLSEALYVAPSRAGEQGHIPPESAPMATPSSESASPLADLDMTKIAAMLADPQVQAMLNVVLNALGKANG